ncbi:E3 ubiquitin-protein ligase WAV3-like isoform X2 [Diospyros lotus]|uniref:E3 ubiquitin-protein ligase WAV3-like isoform X2 n=1 Tax=Diospyros lotus TaxID=55363 RepID=UPI002258D1D4|nr:E3 ubiquitin-protein ligase WAV3-like isoform X2 [Diospyros lotus]
MAGSGGRGGGQAHSHSWKLKKAARKIVQTCGSFSRKDSPAPAAINDPLSLHSPPSSSPSPSVVVPPVLTAFSRSSSTNIIFPAPKARKAASSSSDKMSECGVAATEARAEEVAYYATQPPSSSTTKNLCAICLDPLNYGIGTTSPCRAIFTAQCSHAFHFACISSNIRHGSVTCPICRAHWTQLPHSLNPPPSYPYSFNQTDPILQILDHSIATFRVQRRSFLRSARYDDDDPIEPDYGPPNHPRLRFTLVRVPPLTQHPCHPSCSHHYLQVTRPGSSRRGSHIGIALPQPPRSSISSSSYSPLAAAAPGTTVGQYFGAPDRRKPHYPCSTNRAYLSVTLAHQPATDLVLVASPNGPHLRLIKQAMALVVFSLRPMDRLAIVTYYSASSAARVFPLRRMTSHGKRTALQVIDRLFYSGHVDPTEGLRKGVKILGDRAHQNPESCILHLSDNPMTTRSYHQVQQIDDDDDDDMKAASSSSSSIPIHRFHVGFGFGTTSNGLVMLEFEEFLGRVLGGVIKDIQLRISIMNGEEEEEPSCRRRMVRLGEVRGGEERRIPSVLGKSGHVSVEYSYSEYCGVDDDDDEYCCTRTGETVVGIGGDEHERERVVDDDDGNGTFAFAFAFAFASGSSSEQAGWGHNIVYHHHDPYRARRWAKLLHAYRL